MADPQQTYHNQGYQDPNQPQMAQPQPNQPLYDQQDGAAAPVAAAPTKKKRAYAGQAFDIGTGANVAAFSQQQQAQQQPSYATPAYGEQFAQPQMLQQPQYGAPQASYQAPLAGYPVQTQTPMAGMTQQFGQMGFQQPQPAVAPQQPQQQGAPVAQRLNPLQAIDISAQGQPFHVSDLDLPPPPIILPPNVSPFLPVTYLD